jgi:hypothetical protein
MRQNERSRPSAIFEKQQHHPGNDHCGKAVGTVGGILSGEWCCRLLRKPMDGDALVELIGSVCIQELALRLAGTVISLFAALREPRCPFCRRHFRGWRKMGRGSSVNRAIWLFASLRSAQLAYASINSRIARRSAASSGEMLIWIAIQ